MAYLVNCRDCGYIRAAETSYDMGNGDLVRDQHERGTTSIERNEEGEVENIESHSVALQTYFHEKSEFHSDNFEDNFGSRLLRDRAPNARQSYQKDRVVVVRDEYAAGSIRIYPIHHVPEFVESNRFTIVHAPEHTVPGIEEDT